MKGKERGGRRQAVRFGEFWRLQEHTRSPLSSFHRRRHVATLSFRVAFGRVAACPGNSRDPGIKIKAWE